MIWQGQVMLLHHSLRVLQKTRKRLSQCARFEAQLFIRLASHTFEDRESNVMHDV